MLYWVGDWPSSSLSRGRWTFRIVSVLVEKPNARLSGGSSLAGFRAEALVAEDGRGERKVDIWHHQGNNVVRRKEIDLSNCHSFRLCLAHYFQAQLSRWAHKCITWGRNLLLAAAQYVHLFLERSRPDDYRPSRRDDDTYFASKSHLSPHPTVRSRSIWSFGRLVLAFSFI